MSRVIAGCISAMALCLWSYSGVSADAGAVPVNSRAGGGRGYLPGIHAKGGNTMIDELMGVPKGQHPTIVPRPEKPHTSYLFAGPYDPTMAVPADSVHLYDDSSFTTWTEMGYSPRFMIHSRYGEQIHRDPSEFQTDRDGNPWGTAHVYRGDKFLDLVVGALRPELTAEMQAKHGKDITVRMDDHYKSPTESRTEIVKQFARDALSNGAAGVGFDEPEYWAQTGYEEAFKREWLAYYGTPWEPPHSSVDARYKADHLKVQLFEKHISAVLTDAHHSKSAPVCLLSTHSPIGYYGMGMVTAHHALISIPAVREVLAEVWNVPFEIGYLEYSSMWNLTRGTGKRLWFFMDPMGDHPGLSLDFYRRSFGENLLASLMFPGVDSFEVLAWPRRIYGQVPKEYEIVVNTSVGVLSEMWRYPDGRIEAGSEGIGTFVSDSMARQRSDPSPSDFNGFLGLCKPLLAGGVQVQVLSLDRVAEPGYLDGMKTLLLSYDFLKPVDPAQNRALADWCRRGGSLIVFGGTDAYNALSDSWWRRDGYASPVEHLFAETGLPIKDARTLPLGAEDRVLLPADGISTQRLHVPGAYPITLYAPPTGAEPTYTPEGETTPAVWQASVGKGSVVFAGIAPGFLATTAQGATWERSLVKSAYQRAGGRYIEQPYFMLKRGPYTAIRTLGKELKAGGRFVDLLSPELSVLQDPTVPADECALWMAMGPMGDAPYLIAASGRIRARYEHGDTTSFIAQSPTNTPGVARLWAGNRHAKAVHAFTTTGAELAAQMQSDGDTVLVSYPNIAEGAVVRVDW